MSKPLNYHITRLDLIAGDAGEARIAAHPLGRFVFWNDYGNLMNDYAALQAETVKQIEAALTPIEAYIAKLEAENERLRKAGDDMAWALMGNPTVEAWNAAKGVQS